MELKPSIFNDILGPVMRGPSSSHCAGALRIGKMVRDLTKGRIKSVKLVFDKFGSLATTHKTQGSDMCFFSGILGMNADDPGLLNDEQNIANSGIQFSIEIKELHDPHPNTYNISAEDDSGNIFEITAVSTGGGSVNITEFNGFELSITGGNFETLLFFADAPQTVIDSLPEINSVQSISESENGQSVLAQITSTRRIDADELNLLTDRVIKIHRISPVMPILSFADSKLPFVTAMEMAEYNKGRNLPLSELGLIYECARGKLSEEDAVIRMKQLVKIMRSSVKAGINGANFEDRILSGQTQKFEKYLSTGKNFGGTLLNKMILYVTALMENKSSMGLFAAAPTAGSCGTLPGALLAAAEETGADDDAVIRALFAAGLVGVFIAHKSTFAAEECGCQAETGSAAAMTAAALVSLYGGSADQAINAANLAIQNTFGLVCDPVANRVEIPCLVKNIAAAANALTSANMAMAGFDPVVPLDEVLDAWDKTGRSLPRELRCTALGGLSVTPTSLALQKKLEGND